MKPKNSLFRSLNITHQSCMCKYSASLNITHQSCMCKYRASKPPNVVSVSNDALRSPMMYVKTCIEVIHCFSNIYRSVSRPFCFGGVSSRIFLFTDHISTILLVNFPMISNQFPQKSCFPRHKLCFTAEACELKCVTRAVARALIEGGVYSYIQVVPD